MEPILFVDDDPNVLSAMRRSLNKVVNLETAEGGEAALALIAEGNIYSVIVADMRMPGMDGVALLNHMKELAPDTVRMMLTGNADQATAIKAVNEGNIFRFLTKPCPPEQLALALHDALRQYRLVTAEKQLLQETLNGAIRICMEMLAAVDPVAFSQTRKLRRWAELTAKILGEEETWLVSVAAMLSQVGWVTVPPAVAEAWRYGQEVDERAQQFLDELPAFTANLIRNIPRMEEVADIVLYQSVGMHDEPAKQLREAGSEMPLGARILKLLNDSLRKGVGNYPDTRTFEELSLGRSQYDPEVAAAAAKALVEIARSEEIGVQRTILERPVAALLPGDIPKTDIRKAKDNALVLSAGHELTETQIKRLQNIDMMTPLVSPITVIRGAGAQKARTG
jgi:response regulator RpfG family c-di-GMP phosphodiesterase